MSKPLRNVFVICSLIFGIVVFSIKCVYCSNSNTINTKVVALDTNTTNIELPVLLDYVNVSNIPVVTDSDLNLEFSRSMPELSEADIIPVDYSDINSKAINNEPIITNQYNLSESDVYELATLVWLESGAQSDECQKAVASVILNRMSTRNVSLQEIIYEDNQFSPAYKISYTVPSEHTLQLVSDVVEYGSTLPEYVTYFRADYYHSWSDQLIPYCTYDGVYFSADARLM